MNKRTKRDITQDRQAFNEKSKYIARERREKENTELTELAKVLPLPETITKTLDKASTVKLTTAYLKTRDILHDDCYYKSIFQSNANLPFNFTESFDGFFILIDHDGKIAYVSETVTKYLGLSQLLLIGSNVYDYIHEADHHELMWMLSEFIRGRGEYKKEKSFSLRMRCVLAKRSAGLTFGLYKVIHFTGYLKTNLRGKPSLLAIGRCLPSSLTTKVPLNSGNFSFRLGLDFKISFIDDWVKNVGYKPLELIEKSLYDYVHVQDVKFLRHSHQKTLVRGQSTTKYYRFLCKFGGYVWLQSEMTVVYKFKGKPHCIVALNHIISGIENGNLILSHNQKKNPSESTYQDENQPSLPTLLPLVPTTLILEDNCSEISSYSASSEIHASVWNDFERVEWNERRFVQENVINANYTL